VLAMDKMKRVWESETSILNYTDLIEPAQHARTSTIMELAQDRGKKKRLRKERKIDPDNTFHHCTICPFLGTNMYSTLIADD
jgi:hypothetical protein